MVAPGHPSPRRVFLSHTAELREYPERRPYLMAARDAVTRAGLVVTDMDYFTARDRAPAEVCRDAVGQADVVVLIAGLRYGSPVSDEPYRSYCELEFEEAGARGVERLVLLLDPDSEGPAGMAVDPEGRDRQRSFRTRLAQADGWTVRRVASPGALDQELGRLLGAPDAPPEAVTAPAAAGGARRSRRGLVIAGVAVVLVAALVAGVVAFWPTNPGTAEADAAVTCPPASAEPAGPDGILRIGSLFPQTGDLASQGPQLLAATETAVADVNAAGAIPGVGPVLYREQDRRDEGDPGSGQVCDEVAALVDGGVDAIMGPAASVDTRAVAGQVAQAGRLVVSPASTDPAISTLDDGGRTFRTVPTDLLQGRVLGDVVVFRGARNVAVVSRADDYGFGLRREVVEEITGFGTTAVAYDYDPGDTEPSALAPVLDRVAAQRPDAVVLIGYDEVAAVFRGLGERGIRPSTTPMYGGEGFMRKTFAPLVGPDPALVQGLRGTVPLLNRAFDDRLLREHPEVQDITFAPQAYDAVVITALAAATARSDDPDLIAREINDVTRAGTKCTTYAACLALLKRDPRADIDYDGVSGPLDFTGSGEPCQGQYSVVRFGAGGSFEEENRVGGTYLCTARVGPAG